MGIPAPDGMLIQPTALSSSGKVCGFAYSFFPYSIQAFIFSQGVTTTLGTFGGNYSHAVAINSSDQIVGESSLAGDSQTHGLFYSNGMLTDIGTLEGTFSSAQGINDAGEITGYSSTTDNAAVHAFVYANGVMFDIGTLGGNASYGYAINSSGDIAGNSTIADEAATHAFLYSRGLLTDLGSLGGGSSSVAGLNDSGVVVGESTTASFETHAFAYSNGVMSDLGTLGGAFSSARAVNNAGLVAGNSTTATDEATRGFVAVGNTMFAIGTFGGDQSSANAVNSLGQVVGDATDADGNSHAFLWQNGVLTDLNSLLPADSGWELQSAWLINDSGRIVGVGIHNGWPEAFILDLGAGSNHPPTARAGVDQSVGCGTTVLLDGSQSSDLDGDALAYEWSENGLVLSTNSVLSTAFAIGSHAIKLKVADACGDSSEDDMVVEVSDTTPPAILSAPSSVSASTDASCQGVVPDLTLAVVGVDNCTPSSQLGIVQTPVAGTLLTAGQYTITVTVWDTAGNSATSSVPLAVVDQSAPVISSAPTALTVSAAANCQGVVPNIVPAIIASDNCTPANQLSIVQSPAAGTLLPTGLHGVVATVTDGASNSTSLNVPLTVKDDSAPIISAVTTSPSVLSPPNHQIVPVTMTVVASDKCDPAPVSQIVSVSCNGPTGAGDIQITGALTVNLAASKNANGSERVYTMTIRCTDASGNSSTATLGVTVPKSNANSGNQNRP